MRSQPPSGRRRLAVVLGLVATAVLPLAACSTPRRGPVVPAGAEDYAVAIALPCARTWGDQISPEFRDELLASVQREEDWQRQSGQGGPPPPANYLAISGGGANGAYGAGVLCGWTAAGTRPEFKMVTGISTGALTAPFAFLGPAYDGTLKQVYTTTRTRDIIRERGIISGALFDDALADTRPLRNLLKRYITPQLLSEIARENGRGRLLLVATTNLDSQRSVIWNIGAIASSGHPRALELVREVLLASASIPVAFPPVLIDVEVSGKTYQEMHVDGGAAAQLFLYPPSFELLAETDAAGVERERHAYLIRNAPLDADRTVVPRQTLSIAERAISSLIQTQGQGDLYRVYSTSQRDGIDFNLAFIPSAFNASYDEPFDPVYMQKLFETGYRAAVDGYPWSKAPPGFEGHDPHESPGEPQTTPSNQPPQKPRP